MTRFHTLLELQALDTKLDQLGHRREHLAEQQMVTEAEQVLDTVNQQIATAQELVTECRRVQKRIEDELATQEARATGIHDKLYGGTVTAARELQDLQSELDGVRRHIASIEDEDLVALEALEAAESELADKRDIQAQVASKRDEANVALSVAAATIEAEIAEVAPLRDEQAANVPPDLLNEYDRLRRAGGGVGVAKLSGNRCEGCHLTLPAMEVDRIHRLAEDEPAYCDECGRLLVR